ncbi:hypothetical protein PF010_g6562 [Phytophthora fragariae]|uniref:Cyclic nucleotide-binding domain-containing protein n=1 Tax=Phytophthora fragariae TaxID=53985 RepID=A0A6A3MF93_9STRA|nr:hypothetical protein PF011_g717 [Phytophthora fragariae]KAE9122955.1 hypothetical protein PF010_g6562 [Phytophthora fragariae]KAE9254604.1 hypothetical protein PF004_g948 [Phytophthora fragariae]KAE9361369.1 hypothetical protein PF008_g1112 [Phytophthora fragariae]
MGGAASAAKYGPDSNKMMADTLKKLPFIRGPHGGPSGRSLGMMDDRLLQELAKCFQVAKYAKGAVIQNDATSRFFVVVAEGSSSWPRFQVDR